MFGSIVKSVNLLIHRSEKRPKNEGGVICVAAAATGANDLKADNRFIE